MKYTYLPKGICPMMIEFEIEDNILHNVSYQGGCNGNLKALGKFVEGLHIDQVIERLEGITCGMKKTSCADQLVQGIKEVTGR